MEIDIRPVRAGELHDVLDFWRIATEVASSTDDLPGLEALCAVDPGGLMVAVEGDLIVGTVIVAWDGWRGGFYRLAVRPEQRGRGIARALVRAGEARLSELGCRRVSLYAVTEHSPAMAFWTALGYQQDDRNARFTRDLAQPPLD